MIVTNLKLKNFRNHARAEFTFNNYLNVLYGPNGAGKTNIAEAIYYLSLTRSFRGVEDNELIKRGSDWAEINADILEGSKRKNIRVVINKDNKRVFINSKPVTRLSDLLKTVNIILFEPKDVMLFRGSPKERRNFLDIELAKKSSTYLEHITRYNKLLHQRNEILKADNLNKKLLETTTEMLIKSAETIISYRQIYVKDINDILNKITRALTGTRDKIEICYKPFLPLNDEFQNSALEAYKRTLDVDVKHKATTLGIHREDFSINLNDRDIATYGSQGENRLVALALKLAPYFLIEDKDKRPVIVLDDVMSEFDKKHQNTLIKFLKKFDQVFITATELIIDGANHYQIKKD